MKSILRKFFVKLISRKKYVCTYLGRDQNNKMLKSTLFIDPISFEFTNGPNMNEARAFFGCIVFKSRAHRNRPLVLISGGYGNTTAINFELALEDFNNNNSSLKSCEILDYSIGKKNFETFTDLPHSISGKKTNHFQMSFPVKMIF